MKSFRDHTSLIVALLGILFSLQVFLIVDRAIESYKEGLAANYSVVVVSDKRIDEKAIMQQNSLIKKLTLLSPDHVIQKLNTNISKTSMELLKVTLPKFYKVTLVRYPTPNELKKMKNQLMKVSGVRKIETFEKTHDTTYKLLLLFKNVISVFAVTMIIVTILLIAKELRIWQFKHNERMSIMGLFGAPSWLRSAVLFRLAVVDALLATFISFIFFSYVSSLSVVEEQLRTLGIEMVVFDHLYDTLMMFGVAMLVSITLVSFVVLGHKEEV